MAQPDRPSGSWCLYDFPTVELEDPRVLPEWWSPGRIAFTDNWMGDAHCIDFSPGPQGSIGQIFRYWHDAPERIWLAPSFTTFLTMFRDDLRAGQYIYSPEYGLELANDP